MARAEFVTPAMWAELGWTRGHQQPAVWRIQLISSPRLRPHLAHMPQRARRLRPSFRGGDRSLLYVTDSKAQPPYGTSREACVDFGSTYPENFVTSPFPIFASVHGGCASCELRCERPAHCTARYACPILPLPHCNASSTASARPYAPICPVLLP